jgi:hypothetical protein
MRSRLSAREMATFRRRAFATKPSLRIEARMIKRKKEEGERD